MTDQSKSHGEAEVAPSPGEKTEIVEAVVSPTSVVSGNVDNLVEGSATPVASLVKTKNLGIILENVEEEKKEEPMAPTSEKSESQQPIETKEVKTDNEESATDDLDNNLADGKEKEVTEVEKKKQAQDKTDEYQSNGAKRKRGSSEPPSENENNFDQQSEGQQRSSKILDTVPSFEQIMGSSSSSLENRRPATSTAAKRYTWPWVQGMIIASIFSLVYLLTPIYFIVSLMCLFWRFPSDVISLWFAAPLIISALFTEATHSPRLVGMLKPMLNYFDYHQRYECTDKDLMRMVSTKATSPKQGGSVAGAGKGVVVPPKKFIIASQPHGVISFCGMCAAINSPKPIRAVKTAVASALLRTPIVKNVLGIFGLIDASAAKLKEHFKHDGIRGSVVIYVGGIAELFKSSPEEERLYLSKRKGFIKMALREEGVDIIPAYLFGNTSVLTIVKTGPLADLSRKLQVSLTYFWGQWNLPIPRDEKLLYARGRPMGLPYIPNPTQEDIDEWHGKYCAEVRRLFDTYKKELPMYENKELFID